MKKHLITLLLVGMVSLQAETAMVTPIPAARGLVTKEAGPLYFYSLQMLRETVALSDVEVREKVVAKLAPFVGMPIYPSEVAQRMFEMAFLDPDVMRLTGQQRTDNMGYILSCLGQGNPEVTLQLYAFYYGYSFAYFARKN